MAEHTPQRPTLDLQRPHFQISLDLSSIEQALRMATVAIKAGIDWLEAGTPLITAEGLHAVRALQAQFPRVPIVADLKLMDGGYHTVEMAAKAGAAWCVVMSAAHPATIKNCVAAARDHGIGIMADVMGAPDKAATARRMQDLGVDVITLHIGYDERQAEPGASPWRDLAAVVASVDLPVQAVGGLTLEDLAKLPAAGAPLLVIGGPIVNYAAFVRDESEAERLAQTIAAVVQAVKNA